jgi:hypothetical protein
MADSSPTRGTSPSRCTDCGGEIDMAWPGDKGEICQLCWEAYCSRTWWECMGAAIGDA